jgi:hypothetical protein
MRTLFLLFLLGAFTVNLHAQNAAAPTVPPAVLQAFQAKFPTVTGAKWETKKDLYKASFKIEKRGHDAWFDKDGKITKHKEDFPKSELPQVIRQKLEADFKAYTIDDVDKIDENGETFYQVKLEGSPEDRKLLFTAGGEIKKNDVDKKKDSD